MSWWGVEKCSYQQHKVHQSFQGSVSQEQKLPRPSWFIQVLAESFCVVGSQRTSGGSSDSESEDSLSSDCKVQAVELPQDLFVQFSSACFTCCCCSYFGSFSFPKGLIKLYKSNYKV
jgi:hypothetical protein